MKYLIIGLLLLSLTVYSLDNGLALTPPMGWLSWEWFRCNVDCVAKPDDCLNEKLFTQMIDTLVDRGFLKHGYKQINIDDCWMSTQRNASGYLVADPARFPNGMLYLTRYAHSRGVQLGIYEDFGTKTCQGYPGSMGYIDKDAQLFGSWEVDSLKFDGCNSPTSAMHDGYTNMSIALNKTGRPILYACSWPAYDSSISFPYLEKICNLWRPYTDIEHTWKSVSDIIKHWGDVQTRYQPANGPGHWVDPDMLIIGTQSSTLGIVEYKTQFNMWAIWASPLYMSHDLRKTTDEVFNVLTNDDIIAVNQDKLGVAGRMYFRDDIYEIWARPLDNGDVAVVIYNKSGQTINVDFDPHYIGLKVINTITIRDLELHKDIITLKPKEIYHVTGIVSHGSVIYRIRQT